MDEYLLIMRHEDGGKIALTGANATMDETDYGLDRGIAAQNKFVSGTGLPMDQARVIRNNVVTNGPFGDIKETIGASSSSRQNPLMKQ